MAILEYAYRYDAGTAPPPATGDVQLEAADPAVAAQVFVSQTALNGDSANSSLGALVAGDAIRLAAALEPAREAWYELTADAIKVGQHYELAVAFAQGAGAFVDGETVGLVVVTERTVPSEYATVDELAAAVRTRVTATSTPILLRCIQTASQEIDDYLGRTIRQFVDGPPPLVHTTCIGRGVEWYKANDAALGVIGYNDSGTLTPPSSTFDRHAAILSSLVETWGIA